MKKQITIRHMRIFVAICQEKNITKAAEKLSISQPSASLAVHEMEEYIGAELFERSGRGISLTRAAAHFYPILSQLVKLYQDTEYEMKNWSSSGSLLVGSSISIGACILPQLAARFSQENPEIVMKVTINSSDVIEQMILENQLDFALIEGTVHSETIHSECFLEDRLIPVCGKFHPLARKENVPLSALAEEKFLVREKNSGTREFIETVFSQKGFFFEPAWESTSTAALINAVAAGLGLSVLPERMLENQIKQHQIFTFSIAEIDLSRQYHLIYRDKKYITASMEKFLRLVRDWQEILNEAEK